MFNLNFKSNQKGSALIFTVLILGTMLATALALAAIYTPKILTVKDASSNSVAAIYAADSILEWCLYTSRGNVPSLAQPTMSNGATYTVTPAGCSGSPLDVQLVGTYHGVSRAFEVIIP
jgi:hypothetical protein